MKDTSSKTQEKNYYLVVDFDNLFFNYRAALVNFLGSVSNAVENKLKSPWNYSSKNSDLDKNLVSASTDDENSDTNNNQPSLDSNLLRLAVTSLLDYDTPPADFVKEALSSSNLVLEMDEHSNNKRLKSMCVTFNNSTLYCVSSKDGKVSANKYKVLENLTFPTLKNLVFEVLLLGWHKKGYLNLLKNGDLGTAVGTGLNYYYSTLDSLNYPKNFKLLLVTSFKETVKQFLTLQGFSNEELSNVAFVEKLEDLPKSELKTLVKSFKLVSSNKEFLDMTTDYLSTENGSTLKTTKKQVPGLPKPKYEKVDLLSAVDLNTLSGPVGSYMLLKNPLKFSAEVRKGLGRGVPLIGVPTANLKVPDLPFLLTGVYFGFASLSGNPEVSENTKFHSVVSVGFNPQFLGETHSVEAYLYHKFDQNFYGQTLHLEVHGFLRTDSKYKSLEDLVEAIQSDLHFHKLLFPLFDQVKDS